MQDLRKNARRRTYNYSTGPVEYDEFYPSQSKNLIDEIDSIIGQHFGFSKEEFDHIVNYDIKYRMGGELFNDEDEEGEDE